MDLARLRTLRSTRSFSGTRTLAAPALAGIRVLELASVLAGPSVGQFLAELGADVVKVENRKTGGDVTRSWRLRGDNPRQATSYFSCCNLGKRSLAVDASTDRGRDLCRRLAISSDIVIASYKPGDDVKLGLDAARLRAKAPRLIYAQITGYGLDDPRTGYDAVIQAESGFTFMNGAAAHQAILLALFNRERFGEGAHVHVSLMAAAVASLANQATGYLITGEVPQRMGSDHPSICPYGTAFSDQDGEALVLAVGTDTQFTALCEVLRRPDLAADPRYLRNVDRVINRKELHAALGETVARWRRDELLAALSERKVPAGAVADMAKVFDTESAQALVVRDELGSPLGLRQVAWIGDRPTGSPRRPPGFGEHTMEVLTEELQLGTEEVQRLLEDDVVYAADAKRENTLPALTYGRRARGCVYLCPLRRKQLYPAV